MTNDQVIKQAHAVAVMLDKSGCDGPEGCDILAIAMGIFLECQPGAHREMLPLAEAINSNAQTVFDQMRAARLSGRFGSA